MRPSKILISACLMGDNVRYDGNNKLLEHPILHQWKKNNCLLSICPEVTGGLPIPRAPAEIQSSNDDHILITTITGKDVTAAFKSGAEKTLHFCLDNNIRIAILTDGSPSCGSETIYDGKFQSNKIAGEGVTTLLLRKNKIQVFNENQINLAYDLYCELNSSVRKQNSNLF